MHKRWYLRLHRWFWNCVGAFGVIFGIVVGIYTFVPKISVVPTPSLNPSNPFAAPFILTNESMLPIYSVDYSSDIIEVVDSEHSLISNMGFSKPSTFDTHIPRLGAGGKQFIFMLLGFDLKSPITYALGEIVVTYKPLFYPKPVIERFSVNNPIVAAGHVKPKVSQPIRMMEPVRSIHMARPGDRRRVPVLLPALRDLSPSLAAGQHEARSCRCANRWRCQPSSSPDRCHCHWAEAGLPGLHWSMCRCHG